MMGAIAGDIIGYAMRVSPVRFAFGTLEEVLAKPLSEEDFIGELPKLSFFIRIIRICGC